MAGKRDNMGRWVKGSSGNLKGRSSRIEEQGGMAVRVLREVVTEEEWRTIWEVGLSRAKAGSEKWAKLLAAYDSGKPIERQIIATAGDVQLEWDDENEDQGPAPTS